MQLSSVTRDLNFGLGLHLLPYFMCTSSKAKLHKWAVIWDFQQCGILICVDSNRPVQPPFKLRYSKWCSFSSLTVIEYLSYKQSLWSDCAYAQADLRLCWSRIPICKLEISCCGSNAHAHLSLCWSYMW